MSVAMLLQSGADFRSDPRFEQDEVEYKLRLGHHLARARTELLSGEREWFDVFEKALKSSDNNIITWRLLAHLLEQVERRPDVLRRAWAEDADLGDRFAAIEELLDHPAIRTPGAQLAIGSTLLMALGAWSYPPVRTEVFNSAFAKIGQPKFGKTDAAQIRYARAIALLDDLVEQAPSASLPLRHRLDAQGVLWCVSGGWKARKPSPERELTDEEALRLVANEPGGAELTLTEKQRLVRARLGQGIFRDRLIELWGQCAVSDCANPRLIRASHLKPWKISTNAERLSKFNGLLLTATHDAALDAGLISFDDDGRIILSRHFNRADRTATGIRAGLKLKFVLPQHQPFLQYHRTHVFEKWVNTAHGI